MNSGVASVPARPESRGLPAKRRAILDAAIRVFLRSGYAQASVDAIAAEAGVSKQTIYNHHGDKERLFLAAFEETFARMNAGTLAALASFPDRPDDLELELVEFGKRLAGCIVDEDAAALRTVVRMEASRHPEMVTAWRERGPDQVCAALAARLARLAHAGLLEIDDPDTAARQFISLVSSEMDLTKSLGRLTPEYFDEVVTTGVHTFVRAYSPR